MGTGLKFLSNAYLPFYYITNDEYGDFQLKLLCCDDKVDVLRRSISNSFMPKNIHYPIEHDALTEDGIPVLFCWLLDIPRLLRFFSGLSRSEVTGRVMAFEFQRDLIEGYLGSKVEFAPISFDKVSAWLYPRK
jgi:hypothetical protein